MAGMTFCGRLQKLVLGFVGMTSNFIRLYELKFMRGTSRIVCGIGIHLTRSGLDYIL